MEPMSDTELQAAATGSFVRNKRDLARKSQGQIIQNKLLELGWTQADLVRATGLPRYTISRAVRGENVLSENILATIAKALKMKPDEIVQSADRSTFDDLPRGVHSMPTTDGRVWLRANVVVPVGVHLAIQALANHDQPLTRKQLIGLLNVLDPEGEAGG
jgi:transcriptional regulator with XRE-family HTH domain